MSSATSQSLDDLTLRTFETTHASSLEFELLKPPWFHTRKTLSTLEWLTMCAMARGAIFHKKPPVGAALRNRGIMSFSLASEWIEARRNGQAQFRQVPLARCHGEPRISRAFALLTSLRSSTATEGVLAFIEHYVAIGHSDNEDTLMVVDLLQVRNVTAEVTAESSAIIFQVGNSETRPRFPYTGKRVLGIDGPSPHVVAAFLNRFAADLRAAIAPSLRALNMALMSTFDGPIIPRSVIVVCGPVSAGKSTFLNGLLGTYLFPVHPRAETYFPTKLTFSRSIRADAHVTLRYRGCKTPTFFSASLQGAHDALKRRVHSSTAEIESADIVLSLGCCRSLVQRLEDIERLEIIDLPGRGEERSVSDGPPLSDDTVLWSMLRDAHNPVFVAISNMKSLNSEVNASFLRTLKQHVTSIKNATLSSDRRVFGLALLRSDHDGFPPTAREREEWQRSADLFTNQILECGIAAVHRQGICMDSRYGLALNILAQHERLTSAGHDVTSLLEALELDDDLGIDVDDASALRNLSEKAQIAIDECERFVRTQFQRGTWSIPLSLEELHREVNNMKDNWRTPDESHWRTVKTLVGSEIELLSIVLQIPHLTRSGYPSEPPSLSSDSRKVLERCVKSIVAKNRDIASLVTVYSAARAKQETQKTQMIVAAAVVGGVVTAGVGFAYAGSIGALFAAEGLYGAAAVSSGLATLGGGSLASGGFGMAGGIFVVSSASGLAGAAGAGLGAGAVTRSGQTASDLKVIVDTPDLISVEEIDQGVPYSDCWYEKVDNMDEFVKVYAKRHDALLEKSRKQAESSESKELVVSRGPESEQYKLLQELYEQLNSKELRYSGGVQSRLRCGHGVLYMQVEAKGEPLPILECNWLPSAEDKTSHPVGVGAVPFHTLVEWSKQNCPTQLIELDPPSQHQNTDFILVEFGENGSILRSCCFSDEVLVHNYECHLSMAVAEASMPIGDGAGSIGL